MKRLLFATNTLFCALWIWSLGVIPAIGHNAPAQPVPVAPGLSTMTLIAVGDSITAGTASPYGFTHFLPAWKDVTVHNMGVPSDTTAKMLARFDDALAAGGETVLIFGGTNDVYYRVSMDETMRNIDTMVGKTRAADRQPVLVGPLPRNDASAVEMARLREGIRRYALSSEVTFIDPWPAFADPLHPDWIRPILTNDGVHPNEIGAALLAQEIARGLNWADAAQDQ